MRKLSPGQVEQFVGEWYRAGADGAEVLHGGEWSQAFGVRCIGRNLVARFSDYQDDFLKDLTAFQFCSPDLPVPEVHSLSDGFGGYFCISERAYGQVLETLCGPEMVAIVPAVLRLLDALREADVEKWTAKLGAPDPSWWHEHLVTFEENDRVFGWRDRIATSAIAAEAFEKGLAFLHQNVAACPTTAYLQHNDLLHNNVLVGGDRITAVFDWGCAGVGDFLYELAMFTFYAPWFPAMGGIDWRGEALRHYGEIGLVVSDFDLRLRCYEVHLGLSGIVYSGFKEDLGEMEANAVRVMGRVRG